MASVINQIAAVTANNIRNLPQRAGISAVVVVGITVTVAVLVSVLAMAAGFDRTVANTGRSDRAIVLRGGSQSETASTIARDNTLTIMDAPGIRKDSDGKPIASAEMVAIVSMPLKHTGTKANITLRGISPKGMAVRPEMKIIEGRMFQPALYELIVGQSAAAQFKGLDVGNHVNYHNADWMVVGIFETGGDSHESEMIGDVEIVLSTLRRNLFQVVVALLDSPDAFNTFKDNLTTNPTLTVDVKRETDYYAEQSKQLSKLLFFVAYVVGGIMAVGAIFGALNSMYSAVSSRSLEIGTLRAIGFGAFPVVVSVLIEALLLALAGGVIGSLLAWIFFNGNAVNTLGANFTQVVFRLTVTPPLVISGIVWSCVIGLVGGLFPAIRAARIPVAAALRAA